MISGAIASPVRAQVVTSVNFEPPTFTTGELEGQDGWTTYIPSGPVSGAALIQSAIAKDTQALKIDTAFLGVNPNDPNDVYSYFYKPGLNYDATGKKVNVSYDINIQPRSDAGNPTDRSTYFLGLFGTNGAAQTFVGIDNNGDIYYNDAAGGKSFALANPITETSGWNTISYTADFTTGQVAISLNGTALPISDAVIDPGAGTTIADFDIVAFPSGYDQAVFDNVVVQTPEPGSMALLIPGIAGLLVRRKRK
jgi:hypothetical protein